MWSANSLIRTMWYYNPAIRSFVGTHSTVLFYAKHDGMVPGLAFPENTVVIIYVGGAEDM